MSGLEYILGKYQVPGAIIQDVLSSTHSCELKKGDHFLHPNQVQEKIGFMETGLLISKNMDEEGEEIVTKFYFPKPHFIVLDYASFITRSWSRESIIALEDSRLICLDRVILYDLIEKHSALKHFFHKVLEHEYVKSVERIRQFQYMSFEHRVRAFFDLHHSVAPRLNKKDIASYLGMHRNVLSNYLKQLKSA